MSAEAVEQLLAAGAQAHQSGQRGEAERYYQQALGLSPKNVRALTSFGLLLGQMRDYVRAEELLKTAIRLSSRTPDAYANLAMLLNEQQRFDEAIALCEKALKYSPTHPVLLRNLATNLDGAGRREQAISVFIRLNKIHPDYAPASYALGRMYLQLDRFEDAIRNFRRASELNPGDVDSFSGAGECLLKSGNAAEAVEQFDRALALNAYDVRSLALRSLALADAGRTDDEKWLADPETFVLNVRAADIGWGAEEAAALNRELSAFATNHPTMREDPPENATHRCWHSGNLANDGNAAIEKLKSLIAFALQRRIEGLSAYDPAHPFVRGVPKSFGLNLWAVRMLGGSKMIPHIHTAGWLSGVYYVDVPSVVDKPDGGQAGWIKFGLPRNDIRLSREPLTRTVKPEPGLVVTFPSYFWHDTVTLPPENQEQRLCLAFDLGARLDA